MDTTKVLLIEDNPGDAFLVKEMLKRVSDLDCQLTIQTCLADGIASIESETFSLILLDLSLPDSHGLETAVSIRQVAPNTPVIVLTGLQDDLIGVQAIALGVQDYINKDRINSAMLGRTLHYTLERHRLVTEREKLIQELDAYSHTVAHDLKNPLAIILGYSSLLAEEHSRLPEEDVDRSLQEIVLYAQKMHSIINELLLLAHVRERSVETYPVDMAHVVNSAIKQMSPLFTKNLVQISVPEEWPLAMGYASWLEEVWINYLSNAMKYGGNPPEITVGFDDPVDDMISFWVQDNGAGLTKAETAVLFKPFERLAQVQVDGHGLGLSIVNHIIKNLDGQVFVESEPGVGSRFGFTLPIATSVEADEYNLFEESV